MENTYHFFSNIQPFGETLIVAPDEDTAKAQAEAHFGHTDFMYTFATLNGEPFVPATD